LEELLPAVLLRFRENRIGVIADIRKAFQMITAREADRDYLRFLLWQSPNMRELRVYRHRRVVFGVNCSPLKLSAILELYLTPVGKERAVLGNKLLRSMYVDNCTTSVSTEEEYRQFKLQASKLMAEAKIELREWECTERLEGSEDCNLSSDNSTTKVLGLVWNKCKKTYFITPVNGTVTHRKQQK